MFKEFFANKLQTNLVNSNLELIMKTYYSNLNLKVNNNFNLKPTSYDLVLKLLKDINPSKAAGIDKVGGRFLKHSE